MIMNIKITIKGQLMYVVHVTNLHKKGLLLSIACFIVFFKGLEVDKTHLYNKNKKKLFCILHILFISVLFVKYNYTKYVNIVFIYFSFLKTVIWKPV